MGNEAVAEVETPEEEDIKVVPAEESEEVKADESEDITETPKGESDTDDDETKAEDAPQFTQHQLDNIVLKQKEKLKGKVKAADATTKQANADNERLTAENAILKIAAQQAQQKPVSEPNPDDFDDGRDDPEFLKKKGQFDDERIRIMVAEQVNTATQQNQQAQALNVQDETLNRSQTAHYEKVKAAKIKDYFEHENVALEILGHEVVNQIITDFPAHSNLLLNYFGTPANKDETEQLKALLSNNSTLVVGCAKIGSIITGELTLKSKPTPTPQDPDYELPGSSPPPNARLLKQLDKLRGEAANGRNMKDLMDFKRKHPELK